MGNFSTPSDGDTLPAPVAKPKIPNQLSTRICLINLPRPDIVDATNGRIVYVLQWLQWSQWSRLLCSGEHHGKQQRRQAGAVLARRHCCSQWPLSATTESQPGSAQCSALLAFCLPHSTTLKIRHGHSTVATSIFRTALGARPANSQKHHSATGSKFIYFPIIVLIYYFPFS